MLVVDDTGDVSEQDCDCGYDYDDDDESEDVEQVEVVEGMRVQLNQSGKVKISLVPKINLPALAAAAARATVC